MSNNEEKKEPENIQKIDEPNPVEQSPEIKLDEQKIIEENKPQNQNAEIIVEENQIEERPRSKKKKKIIEESKNDQKKPKRDAPLKITNPNLKARLQYSDLISPLRYKTNTQKKNEMKMTEEEKEKNRKVLYNMNLKLNFKTNPRFKNNTPPPRYTDTNYQPITSPDNAFSIEPQEVIFKDYQSGSIYQIDLKILNRTQLLTSFKYIPPVTEFFTIKSVIYPKKDSSLIAPGMYAKMQILFYAQTMDNFEDEIIILTEKIAFKVPIRAIRDKPAIILKNPLDCGKCLVGDKIERHFICKNNGGDAHFKFYLEGTENQDDKNIQGISQEELMGGLQSNSVSNELLVIPPFTIFPQDFYLYKGMSQNISITFCPIDEGIIEKKLILACDTTKLQYLLRGEQIKVDIIIKSLDGLDMSKSEVKLIPEEEENNKNKLPEEKKTYIDDDTEEEIKFEKIDLSNKILEKEEKLENLIFDDTYPFASKQRKLVLKNISSLPIRYHWSIYDFYHQDEFKMVSEENFFTIEPEEGTFKANEEITFTISFKPINSIIYEQKLELFIEDIPFQAIKQFDIELNKNMKTSVSKVEPYLPGFNSSLPSYPLYSFNLRGRGKLPFLSVNKNIIDLGDVYLGQKIEDNFSVFCEQSGFVKFKMTKLYQQILEEKKEDNYVDDFYKNPCLEDDIIFKDKLPINNNIGNEEPIQGLYTEDENRNNLDYKDVNFIEIYTNHNNFVDKKQIDNKENLSESKNINSKTINNNEENKSTKQKSKNASDNSMKNKMIKSKNKSQTSKINSKEVNAEKEIIEEKININDLLIVTIGQELPFNIKFTPDSLGRFKASVVFQIDNGISFDVDILANVIGPEIAINTPLIDFGLFASGTIQKREIEIENLSPINAEYLIRESRYKNINFNNFQSQGYIEDFEGVLDETKELIKKQKINSLIDYDNINMTNLDIMKLDSYYLKYSSVYGELAPFEKKKIIVSFLSPYPIRIENEQNTIELITKNNTKKHYINFNAQCEEAEAYILDTFIIPKEIFLTMPIQHNNNTITIINPSNLPIHFKWDNVFEADKLSAEFEPNTGEIPPHGKIDINFKIVYFFLSNVDDMFVCHIEEIDIPLGVVVQGTVIGLDIGYELLPESYEEIQKLNSTKLKQSKNNYENAKEHNLAKTGLRQNIKNKEIRNIELEKATAEKLKLKEINLKNLRVNTPFELFIKLKNLSGIPTKYMLGVKNYPPGKEKVVKIDKDQTTTNITKLSKLSKKTQKNKNFKIDHLLLSAAHEEINFTSPKGQEFTKQKQIEKDSIFYLSSQKGIAIVIEPKKGDLAPHSEVIIKISFFNECVGDFHDILTSNIKGLDKVDFPINLRIKGNPLQLSPFQPGINYLSDPPLLKMGYLLRNTGKITKNLKFVNIGQNTIGLDWKIYDYADFMKPKDRPAFELKIGKEQLDDKYKIEWLVRKALLISLCHLKQIQME